jgi:uncharacterized protein YyaL (SSP411 family)
VAIAGAVDEVMGEGVAAGDPVEAMLWAVRGRWRPNLVLTWGDPFGSPLWADREPGHAYVCRDFACQMPVTTVQALVDQLDAGATSAPPEHLV